MTNHVFLKDWSTHKYCDGHKKQGLRPMSARRGKGNNENIKNHSRIHPEMNQTSL